MPVLAFPERRSGQRVRIEHWMIAERQGQAVAHNLLGSGGPFRDVPFFWSAHYDATLSYTGHATRWDRIIERGDLAQGKYACGYEHAGKILAVVTVGDDKLGLEAEAAMEADAEDKLQALFKA